MVIMVEWCADGDGDDDGDGDGDGDGDMYTLDEDYGC